MEISLKDIGNYIFSSTDGKIYWQIKCRGPSGPWKVSPNELYQLEWNREIKIISQFRGLNSIFAQDIDGNLLLINIEDRENPKVINIGQYEIFNKLYSIYGGKQDIPLILTKMGNLLILINEIFYVIDINVFNVFYANNDKFISEYIINPEKLISNLKLIYSKYQ